MTNSMEETMWTIAFRNPRANAFHRVTNWSGTWHQASEMAGIFGKANPDMQVWYTISRTYEIAEAIDLPQRVERGEITQELAASYLEDHGNILVDSGKRIRIRDNRELSAEMLALVPDAAAARARWVESYNAQSWVKPSERIAA